VIVFQGSPNPLGLQCVLSALDVRSVAASNECDAMLSVGQGPVDNRTDCATAPKIPHIHVSPQIPDVTQTPAIWINPAACGEAEVGHVIRFDGVNLPWRAVSPASVPNDFAVLNRIANELRPA
jgi:formylmethanofuran dehydrogenase subunit B